ncbi:MAG: DUF2752 domain-containing protein [Actinobacteria bacterium]|nr:DUF2752 domain-containing protein [Actinomycetota bacterium]
MSETTLANSRETPAHEKADAAPTPGRAKRLVGPLAAIGGIAAATTYLAFVDPNTPGHYPGCPTQTLMGVDCPGCGGLRATHDLAHGDIAGAFGHNALFVLLVPVIVFFLGRNLVSAWTGRPPRALSPKWSQRLLTLFIAVTIVFTLVRNFPFGAYLGSG